MVTNRACNRWRHAALPLNLAAILLVLLGGPKTFAWDAAADGSAPSCTPPDNAATAVSSPPGTVMTADGRRAAAGRIIVGFQDDVSDAEQADIHCQARTRGAPPATVIRSVGSVGQLVDVSGAVSLEVAIAAYLADPRVRYAEPDYAVAAA